MKQVHLFLWINYLQFRETSVVETQRHCELDVNLTVTVGNYGHRMLYISVVFKTSQLLEPNTCK